MKIYLYGTEDNEHVCLDIRETEVSIISHEHTVQGIADKWKDRYMITVDKKIWIAVAKILEED